MSIVSIKKYKIYYEKIDFSVSSDDAYISTKGTRKKMIVNLTKNNDKAYFKYQRNTNCSDSCSEKIAYEIAKILNYKCARVELAYDKNNVLGILNYVFALNSGSIIQHYDIVNKLFDEKFDESKNRKEYYSLNHILDLMNKMGKNSLVSFIRIMIFDALIGEQDRHEENWGYYYENKKIMISPLYDNGDSLLHEFRDKKYSEDYYNNKKDFFAFVLRSRTQIFDDSNKKYKHFDLIIKLKELYPNIVKVELKKLLKLSNNELRRIVYAVPDKLMDDIHKKYLIKYIIIRKQILLVILKGKVYDKREKIMAYLD